MHGAGIQIVAPDGSQLFMLRSANSVNGCTWACPGGKIEEGETAEDAAVRETQEEAGYDVPKAALRPIYDTGRFLVFRYDAPARFRPQLNDEHTAFCWAQPEDAPAPLHPTMSAVFSASAIAKARSRKPHAVRVAEKAEPLLAGGLVSAFEALRNRLHLPSLAAFVSHYRLAGVPQIAASGVLRAHLRLALAPLDHAFLQGGQGITVPIVRKAAVAVSFDVSNPRTAEFLDRYKMDLIRQIDEQTRAGIEQIITTGVRAGTSGDTLARQIRDTVGLTQRQAQAVANYRAALEAAQAPGNKLRDRRFDPTVNRAAAAGAPLGQERIDALVERYRQRYIAYRAMTIARTESLRAANMGGRASVIQALNDPEMQGFTAKRFWLNAGDSKVRPDHVALPGLNSDGVGMDEPFALPDGSTIMFPHDPDADPSETVNCRCSLQYQFVPIDETLEAA